MSLLYNIWSFCNKRVQNYSKFLEWNLFLSNPEKFYENNNYMKLSYFNRFFLILFFNRNYFPRVNSWVRNIEKIEPRRAHNYSIIHNFFSKQYEVNLYSSVYNKRKNSIIKLLPELDIDENNDVNFTLLNLILFNKMRYTLTWGNILDSDSYKRYFKSKVTFDLINTSTPDGLAIYFSEEYRASHEPLYKNRNMFLRTIRKNNTFFYKGTIRDSKVITFNEVVKLYNESFKKFEKFNDKDTLYFGDVFKNALKYKKFSVQVYFKEFYKKLYSIKYKPTDNSQFLENSKNVTSLFIRKNKIFNKGRYSRNRQLYRTGVYWCLWLNIINVFGLYYYFYRFVFNFGYFYLPMLILILSIFGSRLVKYRFYNPNVVIKEFLLFIDIISKFKTEIFFNFLLRTWELIVMLAVYIYDVVSDYLRRLFAK